MSHPESPVPVDTPPPPPPPRPQSQARPPPPPPRKVPPPPPPRKSPPSTAATPTSTETETSLSTKRQMAHEHSETQVDSPPPPPPPPPRKAPPSTKRRRDEESSSEVQKHTIKRRAVLVGHDILFRILLPSKQMGKVIGKGGCRIEKIRNLTKANIKIADAIARHEERVIIISSKDSEKTYTDAEVALYQIGSLVLKDDDNAEGQRVATGHVAANTIRLLISGCQAGGLIGVSGQNIDQLRNSTGATVTVLAQNQLPLCASAHESDRVVQISGDVPAVLKALLEIGRQLRDNPPKQVISISPTYNYGILHRPPQQNLDPSSAEYVTLEMMISETFAGGLIGRNGSNIERIRTESGANIKVHGGKGTNKHRQIDLGGSALQVALAKQRIDEYIYDQMMQQTGGQQLMISDPVALMAAQAPSLFYPSVPPEDTVPLPPGVTLPPPYYGVPYPYGPQY